MWIAKDYTTPNPGALGLSSALYLAGILLREELYGCCKALTANFFALRQHSINQRLGNRRGAIENTAKELIGVTNGYRSGAGAKHPNQNTAAYRMRSFGMLHPHQRTTRESLPGSSQRKKDPLLAHGMTKRAPLRAKRGRLSVRQPGDGGKTYVKARDGVCTTKGHKS